MKEKILYIFPVYSTFVKKDIDFLSKTYEVRTPKHNWNKKYFVPIVFLLQSFFLIQQVFKVKTIIVMFGGYWSFLPALIGKIFNKPVFIILGGTDCVSFPEINYGSLRKPILKTFIKWSYSLCTRLLPVDESLVLSKNSYSNSINKIQGYKFFFPFIKTPYTVVHNGYNSVLFNMDINNVIPNTFITVAPINDMMRFRLKGGDLIIKLANIFPQYSFTIVGMSEKVKNAIGIIPKNLIIYDFLSFEKFTVLLEKSEFYLQLSISEGFPNALCEAMLCNCIPIGSEVGAIPFIIKDTGFTIKKSDIHYISNKINTITALSSSEKKALAVKAKNRISENFDLKKREDFFTKLIENSF